MNWNCKKWPLRYRYLIILVTFVLGVIFFSTRGHAEETVGGHIKEGVFDTLAASAAAFGAMEFAATGNIGAGMILATLSAKEICSACDEFRCAWDLYYDRDQNHENDQMNEPNPPDFFDRQ